jgi:hypothetical protein
MPAKAGIQGILLKTLDSSFRWNDGKAEARIIRASLVFL